MHLYRKSLKVFSLLSGSEAVNQGCSFLRNVILAHFLTKADFGVAALLSMILMLFEMTSKIALGQQIVQSRHGDEPGFVSGVQFTQLAVGVVSATLILAFSWPAAHWFSAFRYRGAIMSLALIPLLNGLANLDLYRQARRLGFGRLILADVVPNVAATLAAWPVAMRFPDYRAVLFILLGKAFLSSVMTHAMAERRFRPRFEMRWLKQSVVFGGPLLLSGLIQFGNFQGDSMVVAAGYKLSQLGEFSVALTMAMTPSFAGMRVFQALSLPILSEVQGNLPSLTRRYSKYVGVVALASTCATLGMIFCGEYLVEIFFGAKYAGVGLLASWLIAAQALRLVRSATVSAAMARGDTMNMMICSAWRLLGLPLAILVGILHGSLIWFAVTGFCGEIAALWASVSRLAARQAISPRVTLAPAAVGMLCVLVAVGAKVWLSIGSRSIFNLVAVGPAILLSTAVFALTFPGLRSLASGFFHSQAGQQRPAASAETAATTTALHHG